jgi:hypothetical protein
MHSQAVLGKLGLADHYLRASSGGPARDKSLLEEDSLVPIMRLLLLPEGAASC